MMATEATTQNLAETPITKSDEATTSAIPQNADRADGPQLNGETVHEEARQYTDSAVNSADVSINGGSDSEAARPAGPRGNDGASQVRSTSLVKKPISFKAVSVNKTFLAAKGVATTAGSKMGDKNAAGSVITSSAHPTTLSARPRLVAKLGIGPKTSTAGGSAAVNSGTGAAPNGNAVWNKNQPAPPQEQKRITDEELAQKYGIHLATRLQSDDPGRQANWADIDDDDDDWQPESIEWTDGTKISLPSADEPLPPIPKPAPMQTKVDSSTTLETSKPKSPAPAILSSSVKLGGMSTTSGRGLVLKGAPEKPTLVAKPPGPPTPVKSPWAALPPVDKVVPISLEVQQPLPPQQSRFGHRDPHGFDAMPPPPAKEIAADDFSRTWRDGNQNVNRELYNSQSGRYEPVNDARRGSARVDGQSRQPAVLQRPSQEQQGHAEPSAAFQTHRAVAQDGSFGRRRASSNVSGGSGNLARRLSRGQETHPQEMFSGRRGSLAAVVDDDSGLARSPSMQYSDHVNRNSQSQRRPSQTHLTPALSNAPLAAAPVQPGAPPSLSYEDEVELQKKIMRESREQARKRRLEEEAKEEAEKKERIRIKLEAMGPAPESKKALKDTAEEKPVPTQIKMRESASTATSPPKPPVIEVAGEVKQYGMMKVHHPAPLVSAPIARVKEQPASDPQPPQSLTNDDNQSHVSSPPQQARQNSNTAPERYSTWGSSAPASNTGRNVWGPPSNDKTLGNGTFNPDLSRLPEIHGTQQMSTSDPGPIGPPAAFQRSNAPYQARGREQRPSPIGPPQRHQQGPSSQSQQMKQATAGWANLPEQLAREHVQQAIEQERRDAAKREQETSGTYLKAAGPTYRDTWKQTALKEDGSRTAILAVDEKIRAEEGRPVSAAAAWNSLPAQHEQAEYARNDQLGAAASRVIGTPSVQSGNMVSSVSPPVRGSRFFPNTNRDVRLEDSYVSLSFARPGSPSPPPPTMIGHPAYDCDVLHPIVSFPRPVAVVKLPPPPQVRVRVAPPAPIAPPRPLSFAAAAATPIALPAPLPPPQPLRQQDSQVGSRQIYPSGDQWQNRIDNLFGRKLSPPKTHALAVNSSSKSALELPSQFLTATVSLPSSANIKPSDEEASRQTKPLAEECFEEQEMGSLPPIRLPAIAPSAAWEPSPLPKAASKRCIPMSIEEFKVALSYGTVHILLPGMEKSVQVKMETRQKSNSKRSSGGRGGTSRQSSNTHPRGGNRSRDASNSFPSPSVEHSSLPVNTARGNGRTRNGAYGPSWSQRQTSHANNAINV